MPHTADSPHPRTPLQQPSDAHIQPGHAQDEAMREGHCLCGWISYQVAGLPFDPHLCSCRHDLRISGAPAVLWVGFPKESLTWTGRGGEPTWYSTYPTLHRGFCNRCGSPIIAVDDTAPDMIAVTGFSLTDQRGIEPVGHSYRNEAASWAHFALAPDPARPSD